MEKRGLIKSWNEDKGFGFIKPEQGGQEVFLHISAMHGDRRPQAGDPVLFIASKDQQGRLRADHVRLEGRLALDAPEIRRKPKPAPKPRMRNGSGGTPRNLGSKTLLFIGLCVLPLVGSVQMLLKWLFAWPLCAYLLVSLISFALYWSDKQKAQKGNWRTPEQTLHVSELLGGWPGALLAQQVFRHKTRKGSYQLVFWGIVALHQAFWIDWLLLDGAFVGELVRQVLNQFAGFGSRGSR